MTSLWQSIGIRTNGRKKGWLIVQVAVILFLAQNSSLECRAEHYIENVSQRNGRFCEKGQNMKKITKQQENTGTGLRLWDKMPQTLRLKIEDSFSIPLKLRDSAHFIHNRQEATGTIDNYYFLEEQMMVCIKTMENPNPIYYSTNEIILTRLDMLEHDYHLN